MVANILFHIRWHWNSFRYIYGLTPFTPALHEIRRMYLSEFKEKK